MERVTPEDDPAHTYAAEGPDDMPSHLRAALTRMSESIPVVNSCLALGTWQGLFLAEHRRRSHRRELVVHMTGVRVQPPEIGGSVTEVAARRVFSARS